MLEEDHHNAMRWQPSCRSFGCHQAVILLFSVHDAVLDLRVSASATSLLSGEALRAGGFLGIDAVLPLFLRAI